MATLVRIGNSQGVRIPKAITPAKIRAIREIIIEI